VVGSTGNHAAPAARLGAAARASPMPQCSSRERSICAVRLDISSALIAHRRLIRHFRFMRALSGETRVQLAEFGGETCDRILILNALAPCHRESQQEPAVPIETLERIGKCRRVTRRYEQAVHLMLHDVRDTSDGRDDWHRPGRHALEQGVRQALTVIGREREYIGSLPKLLLGRAEHRSEQRDPSAKAGGVDRGAQSGWRQLLLPPAVLIVAAHAVAARPARYPQS
jgi:hypothetical protein